ncbi:hypothetical protein HYU07_04565 [Candidatus Woesearchaeota archaeon]|nr:hypothetical protein [Candidatus Woesearchaeota archaeon]
MNKKILHVILVFVLLAISINIVYAITTTTTVANPESRDIKITLISQEPDPAEPAGYVDLRFKAENWGTRAASNVTLDILPQYPFSIGSGDSASKNLGSISGIQLGSEGVIAKFRLKVDENAVDGENEIKVRYKTASGSEWVVTSAFNVSIQAHEAIISVESANSTPRIIVPGNEAALNVVIKNIASSLLKDIRIKLNLNDTPFAPIDSSNEKAIKNLDAGLKETATFKLITAPDTKADVYKVPLEISYMDRLGKNYTKAHLIGLVVGSAPDLYISIESSTIYKIGSSGKIIIKFVNKGLTDIKFVNARLKETNDYEIVSPDVVYVGNVDSDDYETAEFRLFLKNAKDGKVILPLAVDYKDANNKDYSANISLELKIISPEKLGIKQGNGFWGIILLIIIAAAAWWGYSKLKKSRRKKA